MKLDRKQNLNIFHHVCVFSCQSENQYGSPSLRFANIFFFDFSCTAPQWNSRKLDRKQDVNVFYHICIFRADQNAKMATPASDWLRHFRLLRSTESTESNAVKLNMKQDLNLVSTKFGDLNTKIDTLASD